MNTSKLIKEGKILLLLHGAEIRIRNTRTFNSQISYATKKHCGLTYLNEIGKKKKHRGALENYLIIFLLLCCLFYFVSFGRLHGIFGLN